MKHMNVFISKPLGYCHGVVRAIELVKKIAFEHPKRQVYVLGRIVHNQDVINELDELGIITLESNHLSKEQLIENLPSDAILIFTAHGHPRQFEEIAKRKNLTIYDAACPMVLSTHHLIKRELKNNHQIIYIGKHFHPEAEAALSLNKNVFLIEEFSDLETLNITDESPYIINQTTLSYLELNLLHEKLKKVFPKARFANEICNATRLRQEGVFTLPSYLKLVYVVGDQKSSNTNSLVKVAKSYLKEAKVLRILNVKEINPTHLKGLKDVGVISSASTPLEVVQEVINFLNLQ